MRPPDSGGGMRSRSGSWRSGRGPSVPEPAGRPDFRLLGRAARFVRPYRRQLFAVYLLYFL
ncbi:MAG TPA: hypothetical protein PKX16_07500, partial [Kiritimatiellia bacterium]|nr:hypothetical protein [Kiritimatiellia bacterium]